MPFRAVIPLISIIALGFFLGMRHATDPDHVVAVSTIVARHRSVKHAVWIGSVWGLGHSLTILVVGGGIILLGWVIPPRVGLSFELSVGLMLILLGVLNLRGFMQWIKFSPGPADRSSQEADSHAGSHADPCEMHGHALVSEAHPHNPEAATVSWLDRHFGRTSFYQLARPLAVGVVHGLAGSAAAALLVLTTIHEPLWASAYLIVFGIGTVAGMMLITAAIAVPFTVTGSRFQGINRGLRMGSGLVSLAFGLYLAYQFGVVNGLFTAHPHWQAR